MTRVVVLCLALAFVLLFFVLTVLAVVHNGPDPVLTPLSVLILVMLALGIIGALRERPPR